MGYVSPITRATAYFVTAAQWNQDVVDNQNAAFPLGVDAWTAYTPTLVQSVTVTKTVTRAVYQRTGRLIIATFYLDVTGAGTTANNVVVGLPVAAASANGLNGSGQMYDASTATRYGGIWIGSGTSAVVLAGDWSAGGAWGSTPNLALAAGDITTGTVIYEAAT